MCSIMCKNPANKTIFIASKYKNLHSRVMARDSRSERQTQLAHQIILYSYSASWKKHHHLTELGLCEALNVSRSPLRAALRLLQEWGAVEQRRNRGFFLKKNAVELLSVGDDVPPTMEEELYVDILDTRLANRLPDTVTQVEVMSKFGSPRNLVKKVLLRMLDDGLLEREKGRGWKFLPTFDEARSWRNGYQLRLLLEPAGILLKQFRVDHEKLTACRIEHQDLLLSTETGTEPAVWIYRVDSKFHELIASFTNNAFFLQAIQHQNKLRRLLEYRGYMNRRRIADWCREHLEIINALERGQVEIAAKLMRRHLENAAKSTSKLSPGAKPMSARQGKNKGLSQIIKPERL